jgi:hypothetical protein
MTGPGREDVEDARVELYERLFGPLPGTASALQNLMGIWPGGCLLQIEGREIAGLAATVSHGLTNPGLPAPVRIESQAVREERDGRFTRRERSTQLVPAPARTVAPGLAGYGYELVVLTPRPQRWPLQFMNWAVPLVATAITRDQMEFGRTHGRSALLKRLIDEGPGQVSLYEDPPPAPPGPEPDKLGELRGPGAPRLRPERLARRSGACPACRRGAPAPARRGG